VTRQAFPDWAVLAQRRTSSRSGREPAGNCLDQLIAGDGKASILPQQANGYQECANAGMAATIATPRTVELYRASVMERLGVRILLEAVLMAAARRCAPSPGVGIGQDFDFVIVSEDRR
jgi:hypothetical protein